MPVTLANGQTTKLHMTPGNIMVFNQLDIEPTLPWVCSSNVLVVRLTGEKMEFKFNILTVVFCTFESAVGVLSEDSGFTLGRAWR